MAYIRIEKLFSDSLKSLYSPTLFSIMERKEMTMTEIKHEIDANFAGRLNILRAGVLGANDGIISIAGVVIGVARANMSLYPLRKTRKKPLLLENSCSWIRISNLQNNPSMLPTFKTVSVKRQPNS